MPRRRSLHLSGPEKFLLRLGIEPLRLGIAPLRLGVVVGQATVPVLFFLRLILESVTLYLDFQWKIIRHKNWIN